MLIEHAFGIPRRAAGVAKPASVALVSLDPAIVAVFAREPGIEFVVEPDVMLHGRQPGLQLRYQRLEGGIVEDHPVFGMPDDVGELVIE
jgi:hypothetical protein